jgi:4-hydroxy-3-methylbut-2-en-1-yl diphosphate synthase IspG/GcpE
MDSFRTNLSPVEVKTFLQTIDDLRDNLFIRYCLKIYTPCPQCGRLAQCHSGAVSLLSSSFDKITHELIVCLHCGRIDITAMLTCEKL